MQNKVTSIQHYWFAGYVKVFSITIDLTVHGEIVDPRLTFMVCRNWLKTDHMIQSLEFDWTIYRHLSFQVRVSNSAVHCKLF